RAGGAGRGGARRSGRAARRRRSPAAPPGRRGARPRGGLFTGRARSALRGGLPEAALRVALLSRAAHPLHPPGGMEKAVYHLARHLQARGVDTVLFTRPATEPFAFPGP